MTPFDSLDAFHAYCGGSALPIEQCSACGAIPKRCHRNHVSSMVADYDVEYGDESRGFDDVPPEVGQLEKLVGGDRVEGPGEEALLRCPTCRRLYHYKYELEFIGPRNYSTTSYTRIDDIDAFFRTSWCVSRRLSDRNVEAVLEQDFFRHHAIVRFKEAPTWHSLDETNHVVELSTDTLRRLITSDPPSGLDDAMRACRYAELVGEIDDPDARVVRSFAEIRWRASLSDEDCDQVDAARAASRIETVSAERADDHVVVRLWLISKKRLICRIVTVRSTGAVLCEDAVIAENLPVE